MIVVLTDELLMTAVTKPEDEPMVATLGAVLVHTPPGAASDKVVVVSAHIPVAPNIGPGVALTVAVIVLVHPVGAVYVITGLPGNTPSMIPAGLTVASPVLLLLHVPAPADRLAEPPWHTRGVAPPIAGGIGFTFTVALADAVPQK